MRILGLGMALSLISNILIAIAPAKALSDNQIVEKLQGVPIFTLTDSSGAPLTIAQGKRNKFTKGYISPQAARDFIQELQKKNPALAKQVQVRAVRLSDLYKVQYDAAADRRLEISYVGAQQQIDAARSITQQTTSRNTKNFNGVPLFVGRAGTTRGYIMVNTNGKKIIPLFFDREQLQPFLDKFKKDRPELAATVEIQVLTLEGLITTLRTATSDRQTEKLYSQILLYPSRDAINYLKSTSNNTNITTPPQITNPSTITTTTVDI
jgi:Tic22-like family